MPNKKGKLSRRKILKSTGLGIAASTTIPSSVSAGSSFKDDIEQARKIRQKTGDQDRFHEFLRKKGYQIEHDEQSYAVPSGSSQDGEIGIEKNYPEDLDLEATIVSEHFQCDPDPWRTYVDLHFTWSISDHDSDGEPAAAEDVIMISWPDDHFYLNDTYHNDGDEDIWLYDYDGNQYAVWEFDDKNMGPGMHYEATVGCTVDAKSAAADSDRFYFKYYHTYESMDITGISVTVPPSVNFSSEEGQWVTEPLYVEWGERDHNWNNC